MNDGLMDSQDKNIVVDDMWDDIVKHGAEPPDRTISDEQFTDGRGAIGRLANQLKKQAAKTKRADTQRIGRNSEARAKNLLKKMGFTNVKKLSTKWNGSYSMLATADFKGRWHDESWTDKQREMLCEVKHTKKPKLGYPALRKHQTKNLSQLAKDGGIALLIWTYEKEKICMRWGEDGIDGFVKGSPLTIERARELHIDNVAIAAGWLG